MGSNNKNNIHLLTVTLPCFFLAISSVTCWQDKPTRKEVARRLAKLFNLDKYGIIVMAFSRRLGKVSTFWFPSSTPLLLTAGTFAIWRRGIDLGLSTSMRDIQKEIDRAEFKRISKLKELLMLDGQLILKSVYETISC